MRHVFVLLGPPGVGKGTLARSMVSDLSFRWLSSGELLRKEKRSGSEIGKQIAGLIDEGKFAPDELVIPLVEAELGKYPEDCCLLLDGFPRTLPQAPALDDIVNRSSDELSLVLELTADMAELERRILKRADEEGRQDDTLATLKHRIEIFRERTAPLVEYYESQGKLKQVDGMGSPREVLEQASLLIQQTLPGVEFPSKKEAD